MDVKKAFELLDKYNIRNEAEQECKRRKIDSAPYDMIGHNKVYCEFLNREWKNLRDELALLQKERCILYDSLNKEIKLVHDSCDFARYSLSERGICEMCTYNEQLVKIEAEMKKLSDAEKALHDAAEKDFYLK